MIPPLTGWVVQWENALLELGMSRVRSPVWPYLFSSAEATTTEARGLARVGDRCELQVNDRGNLRTLAAGVVTAGATRVTAASWQ